MQDPACAQSSINAFDIALPRPPCKKVNAVSTAYNTQMLQLWEGLCDGRMAKYASRPTVVKTNKLLAELWCFRQKRRAGRKSSGSLATAWSGLATAQRGPVRARSKTGNSLRQPSNNMKRINKSLKQLENSSKGLGRDLPTTQRILPTTWRDWSGGSSTASPRSSVENNLQTRGRPKQQELWELGYLFGQHG